MLCLAKRKENQPTDTTKLISANKYIQKYNPVSHLILHLVMQSDELHPMLSIYLHCLHQHFPKHTLIFLSDRVCEREISHFKVKAFNDFPFCLAAAATEPSSFLCLSLSVFVLFLREQLNKDEVLHHDTDAAWLPQPILASLYQFFEE